MLAYRKRIGGGLRLLLGIAVCFVFVGPFLWMAGTSLKTLPETLRFPPALLPERPIWDNYAVAWASGPFVTYLANSLIVACGTLLLQFATIIPAAYAFARYRFRGSSLLFAVTLATLMIPTQLIFLPVYLQLSAWGLINTLVSLMIPFASSALGIFMLRQAFKQVPDELIEAARLDNASEWRIIRKIMIPMVKPTLATFALLSFISQWNEYFWPLVMTNSEEVRTLPVGVAQIGETEGAITWNILMAGNMLLVAPILVVFVLARKYMINAFVYFGIK